jgi:surface antigen
MQRSAMVIVILLPVALTGCLGLATKGASQLFGEKQKPPAERIAAAQQAAIAEVHGGSPGTPIAWADDKSGIQGTLMPEVASDGAHGCRHYQETVILAGETLRGRVAACPQSDGSWKLSTESAQSQP